LTRTLSQAGVRRAVKSPLLSGVFLIVLGGQAGFPAAPTGGNQDPASCRITVNVDLVVLHATVRDRRGRLVSSLRAQDFEVYEEGVPQRIRFFQREDVPVTVGLVVDHSGSMRPKLRDVITAARTFVQSSNPEDEMFVVNFNEKVILGLPGAVHFTNRSDELERAILKTPASGQTALYDAVGEALERLQAGSRDKKVLVVISDGADNASVRSLTEILQIAERSSAVIYTVGIFDAADPDRNPGVLRRLARATGGAAFFPGQPNEVVAICERIAHDIRNQYTIGYVPANPAPPGTYRAIRVVARAAGGRRFFVRTRAGYIAGAATQSAKVKDAK
jgi:Ca-activated chloride channel family protein